MGLGEEVRRDGMGKLGMERKDWGCRGENEDGDEMRTLN